MKRDKRLTRKYYLNRKVKGFCRLNTGLRTIYITHAQWANIEGGG